MKRIGILTGGGDAPGLNAVIRAVVLTAKNEFGWEVIGIREGFDGLLNHLPTLPLSEMDVHDLLSRGGTILGTANRGNPFTQSVEIQDNEVHHIDVSHEALERIKALNLDALIIAGGDGTMSIGHKLVAIGAPIVGVPKTIDNDLALTDYTFGFDTAIQTATEALEKLQTTAESHHRVMVMEVMGRDAGWIALYAGIAGGADAILIPEIPFDLDVVCQRIYAIQASGRRYSLIVVAEGAAPVDGSQVFYIQGERSDEMRLGGVGNLVGSRLGDCTGAEVRVTVLGHVQRGGQPTPRDRWLASAYGASVLHLIEQEKWGYMVALQGTEIVDVPMQDAIKMKYVDPDGLWVQTARKLGIVFG